jgi:hypothetical protein
MATPNLFYTAGGGRQKRRLDRRRRRITLWRERSQHQRLDRHRNITALRNRPAPDLAEANLSLFEHGLDVRGAGRSVPLGPKWSAGICVVSSTRSVEKPGDNPVDCRILISKIMSVK